MLNNSSVLSSMTFLRNRSYTTQLLSVFNANGQNLDKNIQTEVVYLTGLSESFRFTGNFLKFPVGEKKGKICEIHGVLLDFSRNIPVWENATIPIHGTEETQNIPSNGIFMTPVIPSSGISLYQIIPNAVILFSQFFPIVGISQSPLFHNNGILLSQIYPYDGILLSLNYPNTGILLPQIIPNSGDSLSLFFPNTGISKH